MKNSQIFLITITFLALIEIIPYFVTILFPNVCYGCTYLGKLQQYMNLNIKLAYISWTSYLILFLYLIYLSTLLKNIILKCSLICTFLFMIYLPTLPLINMISMCLSFLYRNPPIIHNYHDIFPASIKMEKHSKIIINEFKTYTKNKKPECIRNNNPGFIIENNVTEDNCWRAIYLKRMGNVEQSMIQYFPNTVELLNDKQIHNAFFSILDPGVEIPPHTGYYKGYLRYHMGVIIPNDNTDKIDDKAYIVCGGEKYIWRANKGIVFDDMYLHNVKNPTNKKRVILYLDIRRKDEQYIVGKINDVGLYLIENSLLLNLFLKNQHSQNKIETFLVKKDR